MESANSQYDVWNLTAQVCEFCEDGEYDKCKCVEEGIIGKIYQALGDLSTDSLDHMSPTVRTSSFTTAGSYPHNFTGEYISDDEFVDGFVKEQSLPPSATDWDSIDSVLKNKQCEEEEESDFSDNEDLNMSRHSVASRHKYTPSLQMTFVDSDVSDKGSNPDVEVYYDDAPPSRCESTCPDRIASCDSGYVGGDACDYDIEHVTDGKRLRRDSMEPAEASARLLECIRLHEEDNAMQRAIDRETNERMTVVHNKNVDELQDLKSELERRIAEVNAELVEELLLRDQLYSYHESLLLDADDLTQVSETPSLVPDPNLDLSRQNSNEKKSTGLLSWFK